jgi:hypothetical protein
MAQKYCTDCGSPYAGGEKFCVNCGSVRQTSAEPAMDNIPVGPPTSLAMPDGLPNIDLSSYDVDDRRETITLINSLSPEQRKVWVRAGQPDILLWPGGSFSSWMSEVAPEFGGEAASAEPPRYVATAYPPPAETNGMATAGFVLSMVSLLTFFLLIPPILGIIFSSIGLSRASTIEENSGLATGKALAAAGLVISILLAIGGLGWLSVL